MHIFTLLPSSFPQAWAAWCGQSYAPCGRWKVRQAFNFTMEPRTDLTQFQADPWTLGVSLPASANSGPSLTLVSANSSGLSGPCSLGQHIHHQAPHRLPQVQAPSSPLLLPAPKTWAVPEAPGGSQDTRLSVDSSNPGPPAPPTTAPAQCWLASMTQGASYGSRLSKKLGS